MKIAIFILILAFLFDIFLVGFLSGAYIIYNQPKEQLIIETPFQTCTKGCKDTECIKACLTGTICNSRLL